MGRQLILDNVTMYMMRCQFTSDIRNASLYCNIIFIYVWSLHATYSGVDQDTVTTSLPVVAHATTEMSDDTAYLLTKTYWSQKENLGKDTAWWNGVTPKMLENVYGKLHPGALKYYDEIKAEVPEGIR